MAAGRDRLTIVVTGGGYDHTPAASARSITALIRSSDGPPPGFKLMKVAMVRYCDIDSLGNISTRAIAGWKYAIANVAWSDASTGLGPSCRRP
jgi:hypothetical protein